MDNTNGWIKLHRKVMDSEFYFAEPFTKAQAWIDLLLTASHKDTHLLVRGNRIELKTGSICMRREKLAERWQWSCGKVDRFLRLLENMEMIVVLKTNLINTISIVNYKKYQQNDIADESLDGSLISSAQRTVDNIPNESPDGRGTRNIEIIEDKKNIFPHAASAHEIIKSEFKESHELVWLSDLWNSRLSGLFKEVPPPTEANQERWIIAKQYVEKYGKDKVVEAIARLPNANFLKGKEFVTFDWLFARDCSKFNKLIEGCYDEIFKESDNKTNIEDGKTEPENGRLRMPRPEEYYQ